MSPQSVQVSYVAMMSVPAKLSRIALAVCVLLLPAWMLPASPARADDLQPYSYLPPVDVIDNNLLRGVFNATYVGFSGRSGYGFRTETDGTFRYAPDGSRILAAPPQKGTPFQVSVDGGAVLMAGGDGLALYRYSKSTNQFSTAGQPNGCQILRGSPNLRYFAVSCSTTDGAPDIQLWNPDTSQVSALHIPADRNGYSFTPSQVSDAGDVYYTRLVLPPGHTLSVGVEEHVSSPSATTSTLVASYPGKYVTFGPLTNDLVLADGECTAPTNGGFSCGRTGATFIVNSGGGTPIEVKVPVVVGEAGVQIPSHEIVVLSDRRTALACYDNATQTDKTRCWVGDLVTQEGQFYIDNSPPTLYQNGRLTVAADGSAIAIVGDGGPNGGFGVQDRKQVPAGVITSVSTPAPLKRQAL